MSVLVMEVRQGDEDWRLLHEPLVPGKGGSISNNRADGIRDVIVFTNCAGRSVIQRSEAGFDYEKGRDRIIGSTGFETIAELRDGESYEMDIRSDKGYTYTARWTHKEEQ